MPGRSLTHDFGWTLLKIGLRLNFEIDDRLGLLAHAAYHGAAICSVKPCPELSKKPREFMGKITVIINNRDLLEWPRQMCADIERMAGLHEIIILDNGSSNRRLLQWYKDCKYKVIFLDNLGHTAPWDSGSIACIETDLYVVTDPDLDLRDVPEDALIHMSSILYGEPSLGKVGLQLETNGIPSKSPYFDHVNTYEKEMLAAGIVDNLYIKAPVDTTFAVYDRRILDRYKICGVRTLAPYVAKHIPWYVIEPEGEFRDYLDNASSASSSYKWFTNYEAEGPLKRLYHEHKEGKVSSKWSSYFPIYEKWFAPYRNQSIKLLEIGVQNGGSLEIWSRYFNKAEAIVGCDINPAVASLVYQDPRIKVVIGAATQQETFNLINAHGLGGFDFIIDDGSHFSIDTISNFLKLFPLLKPGGLFVIEDMHCAYWPEYEGGFFNQRSVASFFKALVDLVNIEHCRNDFSARQLFQNFFLNSPLPDVLTNGTIVGVTAYNSVYLIEKSSVTFKPYCGDVVIAGDDSSIEPRAVVKSWRI